jgi:hypothetical protein
LSVALLAPVAGDARSENDPPVPTYTADPYWPKPLPAPVDKDGVVRQWVPGEPGATCIDSHDHIITVNRSFVKGGLIMFEGELAGAVPAPPVVMFDSQGNVAASWGDTKLNADGSAAVMPHGIHGCFADYEDNIWIGGMGDGVVQKYSHDGKLLLQIGTKGLCDGPPTLSPNQPNPTCGEPGNNKSTTLLNRPADIAVDPNPDPVTGERGSVYIADGYGNHRVVVFDAKGKYLRQWGEAGRGPGQFVETGAGHPHCVTLGNDGLVYACDRGPGDGTHQTRIQVFDKVGNLKRIISIQPPGARKLTGRICDVEFSRDPQQSYMYVTDLGSAKVLILHRESGKVVGAIGRGPGHMIGEMVAPHTLVLDSKGDVYVSETIGGRRNQKFVRAK